MRYFLISRPALGVLFGITALLLVARSGPPTMVEGDAHAGRPTAGADIRATRLARTIKTAYHDEPIPAAAAVVESVAECPPGYRLISGGAQIGDSATAYLAITSATVRGGKDVWPAVAVNPSGIHLAGTLDARAICSPRGKPVVP